MTVAQPFDRRGVLLAAGAASLAACATRLPASGHNLRVVTFNIWHDAGNWPARLPLLVQSLRAVDADVIALQEVLEDEGKGLPNQAGTIAELLGGYSVHFFATEPPGAPKRYGNAILTRLAALEETGTLLEPLNDYRTALRVRVSLAGTPVDVVATHLASQADAGPVRARQVESLMQWLPSDDTPLIVAGDFNAPLAEPSLASLTGPRFSSALADGATATTLNPAKGHREVVIDHIFAERARFMIAEASRIGDVPEGGQYPSDHFGVAASLRLI